MFPIAGEQFLKALDKTLRLNNNVFNDIEFNILKNNKIENNK
jgi:hypothetical protein